MRNWLLGRDSDKHELLPSDDVAQGEGRDQRAGTGGVEAGALRGAPGEESRLQRGGEGGQAAASVCSGYRDWHSRDRAGQHHLPEALLWDETLGKHYIHSEYVV